MNAKTHGRCRRCDVVLRWEGAPKLSEAFCPTCGSPLARTAAALTKNRPIVDRAPVSNGPHAAALRDTHRGVVAKRGH